jgi:hypothetical protein
MSARSSIALAITFIAGCGSVAAVPDSGTGSGSDGGTDTPGSSAISAWNVDTSIGLIGMTKDSATGALALASAGVTMVSGAQSAVLNNAHTHLFVPVVVGSGGAIHDYTIGADGTLTRTGMASTGTCQPHTLAVHPSADYLIVGCASNLIGIVTLVNGAITSASVTTNKALQAPTRNVLFNLDGSCVFATDETAPTSEAIQLFTFNTSGGDLTFLGTIPGTTQTSGTAIHPNGQYLYITGATQVTVAQLNGCSLNNVDTKALGTPTGVPKAVLTPSGSRLFVGDGPKVHVFDVGSGGATLTPAMTPMTAFTSDVSYVAIDPSRPDTLYVTLANGTFPATVSATGALAMGQLAMTQGTSSVWFTMRP